MNINQTGFVSPDQIDNLITGMDLAAEGADMSVTLTRHHFKGIKRITSKAYLFISMIPGKGVWVARSMCMSLSVDPVTQEIDVYIPDYAAKTETNL